MISAWLLSLHDIVQSKQARVLLGKAAIPWRVTKSGTVPFDPGKMDEAASWAVGIDSTRARCKANKSVTAASRWGSGRGRRMR
jgi:hypothetical protein